MLWAKTSLLLLIGLFSISVHANPECNYEKWGKYKETDLFKNSSNYFFISAHKAVDADGAPNAYHPDDLGLDYLANAGYPDKKWWGSVLVPEKNDPSVAHRQKTGMFEGYFISKTSLQDKNKDIYDTTRYVDATAYPYIVFPGNFYKKKGTGLLGDLGYAINLKSGEVSPFIVADIGPSKASLGELSINLAESLGGRNVNPRNGAGIPSGEIMYIVFPYSAKQHKWPLSLEELGQITDQKISVLGGLDTIKSCAKKATSLDN